VPHHRPALGGVEDLRRVEAEHAQVPAAADPAAAARRAERLRRVVEHAETVPVGEPLERRDVARVSENVHGENCARPPLPAQ